MLSMCCVEGISSRTEGQRFVYRVLVRKGIGDKGLSSPEPATQWEYELVWLLLLLLPWRSNRPASIHASVNVLLFLLCRFQNLHEQRNVSFCVTSNEQSNEACGNRSES